MNYIIQMQGAPIRILPLMLALFVSGCAIIGHGPDTNTKVEATEVEPTPAPEIAKPAIREMPAASEAALFGPRVAVVLSNKTPAYENVAVELGQISEDYSIYDLADTSLTPRAVFARIAESNPEIVIAIGLRAATVAKSYSHVPVVFCQVFNVTDNNLVSDNQKGVAALPPLELQVKAWKDLNPNLRSVGAILGSGHESLIEEANQAADAAGLRLHYRIARSDRETLYMFNRLTPDIDGFWLFPDNRVLSPAVLREILSYASRHRVQVAVFNPALLDFGAALSTTSVDSDIAATVVSVARRVIRGDGESIPPVTPLNEIDVQTNRAVLRKPEVAAANGGGAP